MIHLTPGPSPNGEGKEKRKGREGRGEKMNHEDTKGVK